MGVPQAPPKAVQEASMGPRWGAKACQPRPNLYGSLLFAGTGVFQGQSGQPLWSRGRMPICSSMRPIIPWAFVSRPC
eukprot:6822226-Lingulodinium_polyedra.AAC.1